MVTIAVLVVVLSVTTPLLRSFTLRNQTSVSEASFVASLAFARAEAARRGTAVFIVAAAGGSTGNEYANGWDVFADKDGDGVFGAADLPSLRHVGGLPSTVVIHGAAQMTYTASGYLSPAAASSFNICHAVAGTQGYLVTVAPSGLADVSPLAVSSLSDCTG